MTSVATNSSSTRRVSPTCRKARTAAAESIIALLARLDVSAGVVFVNGGAARVVYANDSAAEFTCPRSGLFAARSELTTVDPAASASIFLLIAECVCLTEGGPGGTVSAIYGERSPLRVLVMPVRATTWQDGEVKLAALSPEAILIRDDPKRERQLCKAHLQGAFGLTPAEADVALEIGKGDGRNAAAARLAITPGTVRIHLQRIFDKVGVHRQAELVRLLADIRRGMP